MTAPAVSKANEKVVTKEKVEEKLTSAQLKRSQSATKVAQKKQGQSDFFASWGNAANKKAKSNPSSAAHSPKTEEGELYSHFIITVVDADW